MFFQNESCKKQLTVPAVTCCLQFMVGDVEESAGSKQSPLDLSLESVCVCETESGRGACMGFCKTKHARMIAYYVILHSQTSSRYARGGLREILSSIQQELKKSCSSHSFSGSQSENTHLWKQQLVLCLLAGNIPNTVSFC